MHDEAYRSAQVCKEQLMEKPQRGRAMGIVRGLCLAGALALAWAPAGRRAFKLD